MEAWGLTDPGKVRSQNQDYYDLSQLEDGSILAVVCDGMGGARAGNIASRLAVDVFVKEVRRMMDPRLKEPELLRDIPRTPEQFSSPLLGRTFAALQRQHAQGQTVSLASLGEEFTPQEMSHLSQVAQRRDTTLSDQALKDYIRIITEEYANARLSGPEDLLRLAQRKKQMEHGG